MVVGLVVVALAAALAAVGPCEALEAPPPPSLGPRTGDWGPMEERMAPQSFAQPVLMHEHTATTRPVANHHQPPPASHHQHAHRAHRAQAPTHHNHHDRHDGHHHAPAPRQHGTRPGAPAFPGVTNQEAKVAAMQAQLSPAMQQRLEEKVGGGMANVPYVPPPVGDTAAALAADPVQERVQKNFFVVKDAYSPDAASRDVWNNVVKPQLPLLLMLLSQNAPLQYAVPISLSLLWPELLKNVAQVPPVVPASALPSLKPEENGLRTSEREGSTSMYEDKYNPAPPPPPIVPPLPAAYESDGMPFRGHLVIPRPRAP